MSKDDEKIIDLTKRRRREVRQQALPEGASPKKGTGNDKPKKRKDNKGLTPKMEAYAQHLAAGMHFIEAFKLTYNCEKMNDDTAAKFGNKMKHHPKVKARVEELKRQVARAVDAHVMGLPSVVAHMPAVMQQAVKKAGEVVADVVITRQFLIREFLKDSQLARELGQVSASVAANKEIAKITGLSEDGREKQVNGELERMSPEELKAYIAQELLKAGAVLPDLGEGELVNMSVRDLLPN